MGIYIKGLSAISIQQPLTEEGIFEPQRYSEPHVRCIEPNFRDFLDPISARRMSRIIKRAIITSESALKMGGIENPDAIISGTGLGCVEDTEKFLNAMVRNGEQFLQPTYFIQSTHNTISSQVAIRLKCHGYNNTHVHRGVSFESALQEVMLLFACGRIRTALVGGHDEMTPAYFQLLKRVGYWRDSLTDSLTVTEQRQAGTFAGEGGVSIALSDDPTQSIAQLRGAEISYKPRNIEAELDRFLSNCHLTRADIDAVMVGKNGDEANDAVYDSIDFLKKYPQLLYKPLCGEFFTAPAYGVFTAAHCLNRGFFPAHLNVNHEQQNVLCNVLIFNHWFGADYSFILLSSCGN